MGGGNRTSLEVSNLHRDITREDLVELFGEIGDMKVGKGPKDGLATINFVNKDDAIEAIRKYDGVRLDDQPLNLRLVGPR